MCSPTSRCRRKQRSTGSGTEIRRHLRCVIQHNTSYLNILRLCWAVRRMTRGRHLSLSTCNILFSTLSSTILPILYVWIVYGLSRNITQHNQTTSNSWWDSASSPITAQTLQQLYCVSSFALSVKCKLYSVHHAIANLQIIYTFIDSLVDFEYHLLLKQQT